MELSLKTPMSVKEVLQSLVDDNMVDSERVGTSNYYWAFPSKALHARKRRLEDLEKQHEEGKQRRMVVQQAVEKAKEGRQDTKERPALQKELQSLKEEREKLRAELEKYKECDPEVVEEMRLCHITTPAQVRRTLLLKKLYPDGPYISVFADNVFAIKSWAKRKFGFEDSRLDKAFGIPEDFDYMD
ncbi:hypothetical protein NFI96_034599 [Prochilodus magdalenae]|nr:hypothetical protein NFI96_034599 [Prochilodus magdalenae]